MFNCRIHIEVLKSWPVARDDHIHIIPATQAVIRYGQKRVASGGDKHGLCPPLVHYVVDEPGVLMREHVVILPPDVRCQQVVQRSNRTSPRNVALTFSHLACWLNMESTNVNECFIAREKIHAARSEDTLQAALAHMFAQDFHGHAIL